MDTMFQVLVGLRNSLEDSEFRDRFKISPLDCLKEINFPVSSSDSLMISFDTPSGIPFIAADKRCFHGASESDLAQNSRPGDLHFADCLTR
ncbi:hypothetical protein [Burkholderia sp. Bp8986]|uniref:hypothetical protein n=1 Tax=Burkholderia sp. Bp8986 TaxID=2184550 RepID=UPI000F5A88F9|nr:hypothetical protein [Burkholderia sp. Bp8986]